MEIPDNFKFRFGDLPQYLHYANKDDEGVYHVSWDQAWLEKGNVNWFTCTKSEIEGFVAEVDGWVIQ